MQQIAQLEQEIERATLGDEWKKWRTTFRIEQAPQSLFHLAVNGRQTFLLVDAWQKTRHADLCTLVQQAVIEFDLSSLRSIHRHTARGAPVGKQFQENPLRGALSTAKQPDAEPLLAVLLALPTLAICELGLETPEDWTRRISSAAHNHTGPEWAAFLAKLSSPIDPRILPSVLDWGQRLPSLFAPHRQQIRPTEYELLGYVARLCRSISGAKPPARDSIRHPEHWIFKQGQGTEQEEPATSDLPEMSPRPLEYLCETTPESTASAEPPETTAVFEGQPIPENEPPQADNIQVSDRIKTAFRTATENQRIPYHWDNLSPVEIAALVRLIEKSLKQTDHSQRIPALIVGLSICVGQRPKQIWHLRVSDGIRPGLDLRKGTFIKEVPRPPQSWRPDPRRPCALQSSAESLVFPFPKAIAKVLRKYAAQEYEGLTFIEALGNDLEEGNAFIDAWLKEAREGGYRFTPRRIARILEVASYSATKRSVMAYWISHTANDPPPSGAYYIAAPACDLQEAYARTIEAIWAEGSPLTAPPPTGENPGFVGSRLIPPDNVVQDFVRFLGKQAEPPSHFSAWEDVRRFHNAYTAYVVTLLMFATGHRPVDDPFDGHASLCPDRGLALLDDKNIGRERSARLAPLARSAIDQVRLYREHLCNLHSMLPKSCAHLAEQLECQMAHPSARILPLFFFVDKQGEWLSITPSILARFHPKDWHYPNRLHRHLLATWLFRHGISEEASGQLLGHIDVGTSALSLISPHSPPSLFDPLRECLQSFLDHLGWQVMAGLAPATQAGRPDPEAERLRNGEPFGSERRLAQRIADEQQDEAAIRALIDRELDGAPDETLKQEHVRRLIDKVSSQTPLRSSRRGLARMTALRDALAAINRQHGLRLKLPRLLQVIAHQDSIFSGATLVLANHGAQLRSAYLKHLDEMRFVLSAQTHPTERAAHALFALVAFARVLDRMVLNKVLKGFPYWLIEDERFGCFVEIQINNKNIRRYPIDTLTLALLSQPCFTEDREADVLRAFDRLVARLTGADLRKRYDALGRVVERFQEEAKLELPGYLFAYVSGSAGAVSLPRHAWLRYLTNLSPRKESLPHLRSAAEPKNAEEEAPDIKTGELAEACIYAAHDEEKHNSRALSLDFVHWVGQEMSRQWRITIDSRGHTRARNKAPVVPLASAVRKELTRRQTAKHLTPIASVLGRWLIRLCEAGSKRGAVVASTIATYWKTISEPLAERAHEISLSCLQGDALEEVYSRILDDTDYKNPALVLERLKLFHWFLNTEYGAADIDWSSVVPEGFPYGDGPIDAGIITHAEYLRALGLLRDDADTPELRDRLINATCLILVWRFGLRISEAAGIRRKDIFGTLPRITVRVCNNEFRKLKTDAGLRLVPTVGALTDEEISILDQWLKHIDHCHSDDRLAGLFSDRDAGRTLISQWQIASRIADALKVVTGDPSARIHYGRHGFGSHGIMAMMAPEAKVDVSPFASAEETRTKILGNTAPSRRGPWAISTLIGHAFPGTTLRHYTHLHDLALASVVQQRNEPTLRQLVNALGISERALQENLSLHMIAIRHVGPAIVSECVDEHRTCSLPPPRAQVRELKKEGLENVLRILQAADKNARIANISHRLLIDPGLVERTLSAMADICTETEYSPPGNPPAPQDLSPTEWRRLLEVSAQPNSNRINISRMLKEAGSIWTRGFAPSMQMLLLTEPKELECMMAFFTHHGIPRDRIQVRFDPGSTSEKWCVELMDAAKKLKAKRVFSERIPLFPSAGRSLASRRRRVAIALLEADTGVLRSTKAMHRLLLAAAVASSL